MNTQFVGDRFGLVIMIAMLIAGPQVWATDMSSMQPSKEMREKMAQLHEKMAACLRSERKISECHEEMMKDCQELDRHECAMMKHHHMKPRDEAKPSSSAAK